jgi:hypothetical protein
MTIDINSQVHDACFYTCTQFDFNDTHQEGKLYMAFRKIALAGITLVLSTNVNAAPIYYIFDGSLTYIDDSAGLAAEQNLTVGHTFQTVFLVDMLEKGSNTYLSMYPFYNQVFTQTLVDTSNTTIGTTDDYFFTDLISQSLLHGNSWRDLGTIEKNYGLNHTEKYMPDQFNLYGSNSPNTTGSSTELTTSYQQFSELTIGKEFRFKEVATVGSGDTYLQTSLYGTATLARITDTYITTVPEPSSALLFGAGLLSLVGFSRYNKEA